MAIDAGPGMACLAQVMAGLKRLVGAAALVCLTAPALHAEALSAPELRGLAIAAVERGQAQAALDMARALLVRDPTDATAHLVQARALRDLGQVTAAQEAAAAAWDAAKTRSERYNAAKARAQVLSTAGNRTMAQLWLRRAAQHAPDDMHRASVERDYAYLRARNRLNLQFDLSVTPNSNINNGSDSETGTLDLVIFGQNLGPVDVTLTGASRALSGIEYRVGGTLRYRLDDGMARQRRTDLYLQASHRAYTLSEDAKDIAPDADGADFAFTLAQATLARSGQTAGQERLPFQLSLGAGRSRYGGEAYTRFFEVGAAQRVILDGGKQAITLRLGLSEQHAESTRTADAHGWTLGAGWQKVVRGGDLLSMDVGAQRNFSEARGLDYAARSIAVSYRTRLDAAQVGLEFGVQARRRDYDRGPVAGMGRQDTERRLHLSATLDRLDLYGFVPQVTVEARRNESEFDQYDAEELGLRLGLRSAF